MSNSVTTFNAPTFAVSIGTKKAPQSFTVDTVGASLAAGKNGREARVSLSKSMVQLAVDGRFATLSGYLVATFPRFVSAFTDRVAAKVDHLESLQAEAADGTAGAVFTEADDKLLGQLKADPMNCRSGFNTWCQVILTKSADAKLTKAQATALEFVKEYGTAMAEKLAAAKAQQAQ